MSVKLRNITNTFLFGMIFIYFAIFRFLVIPSGDDYFWYGPLGNYLFHHDFFSPLAQYGGSSNGRYLGNTFEIMMMHHLWIAMLLFAIFWTLLIWGIWQLSGKTFTSLLLSTMVAFTLQGAFINNILVWNAGFVNYVPPTALILTYLAICKMRPVKYKRPIGALTFLIGVTGGLFLENATVLAILLAIIVMAYLRKKVKIYHVSYFIGAIISAVIMFSHKSYSIHNQYRATTTDPTQIWTNFAKCTHFWLVSFNWIVLIVTALAIIVLTIKSHMNLALKIIYSVIAFFFGAYYLYMHFVVKGITLTFNYTLTTFNMPMVELDAIISILLIIFIGVCIVTFFTHDQWMILYYLFAGISFGPLLFVTSPITARAEFVSYIFIYLITINFVIEALKQLAFSPKIVLPIVAIVLFGLVGNTTRIMVVNYQANAQRVQAQSFLYGNKPLTKHVPYVTYVWSNDMLNQQSSTYWKLRFDK